MGDRIANIRGKCGIAFLCVMLAALASGCGSEPEAKDGQKPYRKLSQEERTAWQQDNPEGVPFTISNVRIHDRLLSLDIAYDEQFNLPEAPNMGLLVFFTPDAERDMRKLGNVSGAMLRAPDEILDGELVYSTLIPGDGKGYQGAYWYGSRKDADWRDLQHQEMNLEEHSTAGKIDGPGVFKVALVEGRLTEGPLVYLSNEVIVPQETH